MNRNKFLGRKSKRSTEIHAQQQAAAAGPYTLSMSFNIEEVNSVIEQYKQESGLKDEEATPEHIAYSVYHGDLIICLKNILIPLDQEWTLNVDSYYLNPETGEDMTVSVEFEMEKMPFNDFKFGSKLTVDRGHGLKTRWRGINTELNELLYAEVPEGYELKECLAKLTCTTGFTDYKCLQEFNFVKRVIKKEGLDGIKNLNRFIQQNQLQVA